MVENSASDKSIKSIISLKEKKEALCAYVVNNSEKADGLVRMYLNVARSLDITFKTTRPKSAAL